MMYSFYTILTRINTDTGGEIAFRWDGGQDMFYPRKGDLFLVSNERGYWHK